MALTVISQPKVIFGVFGPANYTVETDNSLVDYIHCEVFEGIDKLAEQYAPVFGDKGYFELSPLLSSLLTSFDNPIAGATSDPYQERPFANHRRQVTIRFTELIGGSPTPVSLTDRKLVKSVITKYDITGGWIEGGNRRALFAHLSQNDQIIRHAFKGQKITISSYGTNEFSPTITLTNAGGSTSIGGCYRGK
jgi:hypothetical protein